MRRLALVTLVTPVIAAALVGLTGCPSSECITYVKCQEAYDDAVDVARYRDGGECWDNLQTSQLCTEQCKVALAALAEVPGAPAACSAP